MTDWKKVRWTQARQVTALLGEKASIAPEPTVTPQAHFAALRDSGRAADAASFFAVALPRFDAILWAAAAVGQMGARPAEAGDEAAFAAVESWLADPDDRRRRAANDASDAAEDGSPEKLLALAVFFSGGSVAPVDCQPINPAPEMTGKFAGGAVIVAAHQTADPAAALARALDAGDAAARSAG